MTSITRMWRAIHKSGLLVPLVFIALSALLAPIAYPGEYDVDEGVNLMKALLVSRGYNLYSDIWSDQAPLATIFLSQWLRWLGASVVASRVLILLSSALLLWAFYQTIRSTLSEAAGLLAAALLVLSAWYMRLSISVMIGLPALALAMLSLYLLLLAQKRASLWLILASGAALAASMQTKLFTAIVAPVIVVYLLFLARNPGEPALPPLRQRMERSAVWLGALLAGFVLLGLAFGSLDPRQLVAPHLGAATRTAFLAGDNLAYIGSALIRNIACLPLAVAGLAWGIKTRQRIVFLPLGWLLMAFAFLLYERPLWYHHVLIWTIPLVWLSAFGIEAGLRGLSRLVRDGRSGQRASLPLPARVAAAGTLLLFGTVVALLAIFNPLSGKPHLREEIPGPVPAYGEQVADWLCPGGRSKEAWVFTDRPIYAFQAGLRVPPPMAVLSAKRLFSGAITEADLLAVLRAYRPGYVLLERHLPQYSQDFLTALSSDYDLAREYSLGAEGWPGRLMLPRSPGAADGASTRGQTARFGGWLSLQWNPASAAGEVEAGDCLQVRDLEWIRPDAYSAPDLAVSVRLADSGGEVWAQRDERLGDQGNTLRDRAQLPYFVNLLVPEGTPPGVYDAQIVVYDPQSSRPLPVTTADVEVGAAARPSDGGDRLTLGQVRISRPARDPALRRALADFGPIRLIKAETPATQVSAGDAVPLSLLWQAGPDLGGQALVVVVQLLDKEGNVVASLEEEPLQGRQPSTAWESQQLVRDRHVLTVPPGTPDGRYSLIVGVYTQPERTRLETATGFLGLASRDYYRIRPIEVASPSP